MCHEDLNLPSAAEVTSQSLRGRGPFICLQRNSLKAVISAIWYAPAELQDKWITVLLVWEDSSASCSGSNVRRES